MLPPSLSKNRKCHYVQLGIGKQPSASKTWQTWPPLIHPRRHIFGIAPIRNKPEEETKCTREKGRTGDCPYSWAALLLLLLELLLLLLLLRQARASKKRKRNKWKKRKHADQGWSRPTIESWSRPLRLCAKLHHTQEVTGPVVPQGPKHAMTGRSLQISR